MNICKVLKTDMANFKCNITVGYYYNSSLCCFLTSFRRRALEARPQENEQCLIDILLGHVYYSEVATKTVSFGLKEAKQCIMSMMVTFLEPRIRPYDFTSLIILIRQVKKII